MARSIRSGQANRSKKSSAARKLSMPMGALFFPDLSMHTHTWFLREIASTISNGAHAAKVMSKSQRPRAEFGRLWKKRAQPAAKSFSLGHENTQNGFCALEPRQSRQSRVTD